MFSRHQVRPTKPVKVVRSFEVSEVLALGETYILNYFSRRAEEFHAKSDASAIVLAKRKLGLVITAGPHTFKWAGGKNIVRKSTGLPIYPPRQH